MTEQGERGAEGVCEDEVGRQEFHAVVDELEDDRVGGGGVGGLFGEAVKGRMFLNLHPGEASVPGFSARRSHGEDQECQQVLM